jgi:methylated-DNA-[protein]-cysteine S-methyltransferase
MKQLKQWDKHPLSLHCAVIASNNTIQKVTLDLKKNGFSLSIEGSPSPYLYSTIHQWVDNYLSKKENSLSLPFSLDPLSPFTRSVLKAINAIPFGHTNSYKEIAEKLQKPKAFRAAGTACGKNPFPLFIPCHRVIKTGGALGGFSIDLTIKELLLSYENC